MNAKYLAAFVILATLMLPFASAGVATVTRENHNSSGWVLGSQNNVPAHVLTSEITGLASIGTCVSSCQIHVDLKVGCTGSTFNGYESAEASPVTETFTFRVMANDCFWVNGTGTGGTPGFGVNRVWFFNTTTADYEGQNHANVTRLEMNATRTTQNDIQNTTRTEQNDVQNATARATFEGQLHANITRNEMNVTFEQTYCRPDDGTALGPFLYCIESTYAINTFEGQNHANITRDEMNATTLATYCKPYDGVGLPPSGNVCPSFAYAEATYEGQEHANSTWCPLPCVGGSGDFVGNQWFNETWRWNPVFGNVSALSLNVGWTNTSELDVLGNVTLVTQADPFIPFIVWGGLFLFFAYFVAWLPMMACLLALGATLPNPDLWSIQASVMLFCIAVFLHVLVTRSLIPAVWGRKDTMQER